MIDQFQTTMGMDILIPKPLIYRPTVLMPITIKDAKPSLIQ